MTTNPPISRNQFIETSGVRWRGALEGLHQNMLYGWAYDTTQPQSRVVVEICLNGEAFGCAIADVARTDVADAFEGDVCHGFVADIGVLAQKESGVLTARIANTHYYLDGEIALSNPKQAPMSACSQVFSDGALRLFGWAVDPQNEARALSVRAYLGAQQIATATANLTHPAIRPYDVGPHGFTLDLPLSLADGQSHKIRIVDESGRELNGSPVTVCCYAAGAKALLDESKPGLLADIIDVYERYVPRSLGFQHYAEWSRTFNQAAPSKRKAGKAAKQGMRVAVIVTGDGDYQTTLTSLKLQTGVVCDILLALEKGKKPQSFPKLLQQALASDAEAIACVRAGDTLPERALALAAEGFNIADAQIVYGDSIVAGQQAPWFKPAWNPEYALATDYPLELMLVRTSLAARQFKRAKLADLPGNPAAFAWTQLAQIWEQGTQSIVHVPHVLYQFHSVLSDAERGERTAAAQAALSALEPKSVLKDIPTEETPADFTPRSLHRPLTRQQKSAKISLIIPTRDQADMLKRCIDSIRRFTDWPGLEIIVIDNGSVEPATKSYFRSIAKQGVRVLPMPGPFNFASLNNRAVEAASGDIIGLINNDVEALHKGWLEEIISHLLRPGVGAVGAKLLWPNGMVQHGGVLLGVGAVAGHFGNLLAENDWGDHGRNVLTQQVSGVTAACLFLRKADYLAVGSMNETAFPVAFNDVDLCLKLRAQDKAIVWTPNARLLHAESVSRGREDTPQKRARAQREIEQLRKRWGGVLLNDPAYHPSLNLDPHAQAFGGLALPPRDRSPRLAQLKRRDV
jgi:GT2 family glycosyltransferase